MDCRLRSSRRRTLVRAALPIVTLVAVLTGGCSFDYGSLEEDQEKERPDLAMNDVEYVRVRDGEILVRVQAEKVERFDQSQTMRIRDLRFEQFGHGGEKVESVGEAGSASVELESGDVRLSDGVKIIIDSEDLSIETDSLHWQDTDRLLKGDPAGQVRIKRTDGTVLNGQGFVSDARRHSWEFSGPINGIYIEDEEKDKKDPEGNP